MTGIKHRASSAYDGWQALFTKAPPVDRALSGHYASIVALQEKLHREQARLGFPVRGELAADRSLTSGFHAP